MKRFLRGYVGLIVFLILWGIWANAQQPTTPGAAPSPAQADATRPTLLDVPSGEKGV